MKKLTIYDHSRNFNNYTYIYPVISRRSKGLSLGINLNINNACNWRCVYCQVDNLIRGKPEPINLALLEKELNEFLDEIINKDFLLKFVPEDLRNFNDISLSGNGEPTMSLEFLEVTKIITKLKNKFNLTNKTILITNGSEIDRLDIVESLKLIAQNNGEIWFKIDSVTKEGIKKINQVNISISGITKRLKLATSICNTYIQTCLFKANNELPPQNEINEYLNFIDNIKGEIKGVLLYSIARKPALIEGKILSRLNNDYLKQVADILITKGVNVAYYE